MLKHYLFNKILNLLFLCGKKDISFFIFKKSCKKIFKFGYSPQIIFVSALINCKSLFSLRKPKSKRHKFLIPVAKNLKSQLSGAISLIKKNSTISGSSFINNFVLELINAALVKGKSVDETKSFNKQVLNNKIYRRYKWS